MDIQQVIACVHSLQYSTVLIVPKYSRSVRSTIAVQRLCHSVGGILFPMVPCAAVTY